MASPSLTQSQLKELLYYDPDTGLFINKISRGSRALAGAIAGDLNSIGYWRIAINCSRYSAHRLAWLYVYGSWPKDQIDHINRIRHDNRISNLREVTISQNLQNVGLRTDNTSGYKGVCWSNKHRKWQAQIKINNVYLCLGRFKSLDDAIAVRKQAEEQLHTHRSVA
jgi:hypothetical protein